jgi:hypothetical protein
VSGLVPVGSFGGALYDPFSRLEGRRLGKRTTEVNASAWGGLRQLCRTKRSSTSDPVVGKRPAIGKGTTETGDRNRNRQVVIRPTPLASTDHNHYVYVLRCGTCGYEYGANGSDIHLRRCPNCQGGAPGLPVQKPVDSFRRNSLP